MQGLKKKRVAMGLMGLIAFFWSIAPHSVFAQSWPEGPGRERVVGLCGACHEINRLRIGYTPDGWRTVERMMRNMDVPVPEAEWPIVTDYLIKNFPERARPAAVIVPGPVQVAIKEWQVPTPGSRPHDPLATRDGHIWWTGQLSNIMGRLNPKTGEMKEFKLTSQHTGPHGLTEDAQGNVWFTGNNIGVIGKLDPKTGNVTEYKMPDSAVKDPHTMIFDRNGILWFTAQNANIVGRLDPKSGEIKILNMLTPKSRPYGMAVDSKNQLYVVLFGTNKIAKIDTATSSIKEYVLPAEGSRPRRLAIDGNDKIWYADFPRGFLGQLDPVSGAVKEWQSPSGVKSEPYGIVFTKGALYYNESGAKPNTIVRFDPLNEKFQSWAIPGGGDIVRNMDVTPDGNPVLANSLTNEVGLVEIR